MPGDNQFVTENFLRLNFSPKPGITPGTNDTLWLNCDQITARYYVAIAGTTSTGKRWPRQNQLSDSITLPTVSTGYITAITATTATGSGNVSADGGATVTDRGIQWSIYSNFSVIAGSASGGSGTGSFTANMTGLTPGTTYYVRAYATNSVGTAISYTMSFTTSAASYQITYISSALHLSASSPQLSITIPSSKILIVTISCMDGIRSGSAPTCNGNPMTQVGSYSGSFATEVWYLLNPSTGSNTIQVPQAGTVYMAIVASWYSCIGSVSLYSHSSRSAVTAKPSESVSIPSGQEVLTICANALQANASNTISSLSTSDNNIGNVIFGAIYGYTASYATFHSSQTSKTMSATINAAFNCKTVIASFVST